MIEKETNMNFKKSMFVVMMPALASMCLVLGLALNAQAVNIGCAVEGATWSEGDTVDVWDGVAHLCATSSDPKLDIFTVIQVEGAEDIYVSASVTPNTYAPVHVLQQPDGTEVPATLETCITDTVVCSDPLAVVLHFNSSPVTSPEQPRVIITMPGGGTVTVGGGE